MAEKLEPLSPDIAALLAAERAAPAPSSDRARAVGSRLMQSIALGAPLPSTGDVGAPAADGAAGLLAAAKPTLLATVFAAGAAAGVGGTLAVEKVTDEPERPAVVVSIDAGVVRETLPSPDAAVVVEEPEEAPPAPVADPTSPPAAPRRARADSDLAEERALIERARTAITRGDAAAARATLDEHRTHHRRGRLAEEREALAVHVLSMAGDVEAARARGARFLRRYPRSLFRSLVERAMGDER